MPPGAHPLPANPLSAGLGAHVPPSMGGIPVPPPAFGQPPPMMPMGMHPARLAQMGGPPPQMAGQVRPLDAMDESPDMPPAKRQRVQKLPNGQFYPEADWVNMHPVSLTA
jgi:splicing factor 3A subunit 1